MSQRYLPLLLMMLVMLVSANSLFGAAAGDVRLIDAVKKADVKAVNALLKQSIDVNSTSPKKIRSGYVDCQYVSRQIRIVVWMSIQLTLTT